MLNHLPDRVRFAPVALDISGLEPVEAALRVVRLLLLGVEHDKAVAVSQRRPAGAMVIAGGRLRAAMEDDHEGRRR